MERWKIDVIRISDASGIKQIWRWDPFPPPRVLWECLKDRMCAQCHGTVSPFVFIGKLPDGRYLAFRRPAWLLRNGCTGLVLVPPPTPMLFSQPPQTQAQPKPVDARPPVVRVVDLPKKKRSRKPAKKPIVKASKKADKKAVKKAPKKAVKKPMKKVAKKASRHRRKS